MILVMAKQSDKPVTKNELEKFVKEQIHTLDLKLDKIIGMFKKFDEEQTLQAGKLSDHEDRLEGIEGKVGSTT